MQVILPRLARISRTCGKPDKGGALDFAAVEWVIYLDHAMGN